MVRTGWGGVRGGGSAAHESWIAGHLADSDPEYAVAWVQHGRGSRRTRARDVATALSWILGFDEIVASAPYFPRRARVAGERLSELDHSTRLGSAWLLGGTRRRVVLRITLRNVAPPVLARWCAANWFDDAARPTTRLRCVVGALVPVGYDVEWDIRRAPRRGRGWLLGVDEQSELGHVRI